MIRKFNYTGRKKIKRSAVRVDLVQDSAGRRCVHAQLQLTDMALPANAHVYVEAYQRTAYQRFDYGTVGGLKPPADPRLSHFSDSATPLFRVKIVDRGGVHGRILAAVDKIRPESVDSLPSGSHCLLYVEYHDLGGCVWQLDLEGDWPVLKLNRAAEEINMVASSDRRFLPLVYPEVLRQVLTHVLIVEEHTDPDCDDDWPSLWLKLACSFPGMAPPPQAGSHAQREWIEKAVDAFSANNRLIEKFNQSIREAS